MESELEQQIDELIQKFTKDLKTKILRVVYRHQNKLLKDQARDLKGGAAPSASRKGKSSGTVSSSTKGSSGGSGGSGGSGTSRGRTSKKDDKNHNDSDTDGYYSE